MTKIARLLVAALFLAILPLSALACGDGGTGTSSGAVNTSGGSTVSTKSVNAGASSTCDKTSPSIIPRPSGQPQLVYFFRET